MAGRKPGRVIWIDFGGATGRETEANGSDDVLGTEAGKFHDGPSNLARRNAPANGNVVRGEGVANSSDGVFGTEAGKRARKLGDENR